MVRFADVAVTIDTLTWSLDSEDLPNLGTATVARHIIGNLYGQAPIEEVPKLVIESGLEKGTVFRLREKERHYVLGRSSDSDFFLPSDQLSRKHAKFIWTDGAVWVSDLDSKNGVQIRQSLREKSEEEQIVRGGIISPWREVMF